MARSTEETGYASRRVIQAERKMTEWRQTSAIHADAAGIYSVHAGNPLAMLKTEALAELTPRAFDSACSALNALVVGRREQIALLRQRQAEMVAAEAQHAQRLNVRDERQDAVEAAAKRREQADADVEHEGQNLLLAWDSHFATLKQLQVSSDDSIAALTALTDWVVAIHGDNPAQHILRAAQQQASLNLAQRRVALEDECQALETERKALEDERGRLEAGIDTAPPLPHTRDANARNARDGAPLWQLVDFRAAVTAPQRAGLEAALEGAGLLDAWVSPDGRLQTGGGVVLHDTQVLERLPHSISLGGWLQAAVPANSTVPANIVERVLSSITCADDDLVDSETWVALDGRFRLGGLAGAWTKPAAAHIGYAARTAARTRRLAEIAERLISLDNELVAAQAMAEQLAHDQNQAAEEWRLAPTDETLRNAHLAAVAAAREVQLTRERLAEADIQYREAEQTMQMVREQLTVDATDLRLPKSAAELPGIEAELNRYHDTQVRLTHAIHELRLALLDLQRQHAREAEVRNDMEKHEEQLGAARIDVEEASSRLEVLREMVGAKVEELERKLTDARAAVEASDDVLKIARSAMSAAGEARAVAAEQARTANVTFEQRSDARAQAVSRFQQFAAAGLFSAALPHTDLPDMGSPWTIDPALTMARRAEQVLSGLKDDDEAWTRVQRQIGEDLTELQRSLSALGHQALAEQSDWRLIVHVVYQNRPERPNRLAGRLAEEIAQRRNWDPSNYFPAARMPMLWVNGDQDGHFSVDITSRSHEAVNARPYGPTCPWRADTAVPRRSLPRRGR